MKKRSILQQATAGSGCKVCRTIRPFLIVAVSLIALLWSKPEWRLPPDVDYSVLVGDIFVLGCLAYLVWRIYDHRKQVRACGDSHDSHDSTDLNAPVRRSRRRNRVAGDPRGWK